MTAEQPKNMASGTLRAGLRTSPATMVMSCHESAENSEPDCATQSATSRPNALPAATPSEASNDPSEKALVKFACTACEFQPRKRPIRLRPASAMVFADVNRFWMMRPYSIPRELVQVRTAMTAIARSCAVERWEERRVG